MTSLSRFGYFLLLLIFPAMAIGHAQLLSHSPTDTEVYLSPPSEIRLEFNEPVSPIFVRLIQADGRFVDLPSEAVAQNTTVTQALPGHLEYGHHLVSWRVISADSHPVGGSFPFAVGDPAELESLNEWPAEQASNNLPETLYSINRTFLLVCIFLVTGCLWFPAHHRGLKNQPDARRAVEQWTTKLAAGIMLASVSQILLLSWRIAGEGMALSEWPAFLKIALDTPLGQSTLVAFGAACTLFALNQTSAPARRSWLSRTLALILVTSLAFGGHAIAHDLSTLTIFILSLHLILAAYWFGALPVLWQLSYSGSTPVLATWLDEFSRYATWLVCILILTGIGLSLIFLAAPSDLIQTDYGNKLLVKLAFLVCALALAVLNKYSISQQLAHNIERARSRLRISLAAELLALTAVIAVAVLLSNTMPPTIGSHAHQGSEHHLHSNQGHASHGQPIRIERQTGEFGIVLETAHNRPGRNRLVATVTRNDEPFVPLSVEAVFSLPELEIEPRWNYFVAEEQSFVLETDSLMLQGRWHLQLEVLISDFEKLMLQMELPITLE